MAYIRERNNLLNDNGILYTFENPNREDRNQWTMQQYQYTTYDIKQGKIIKEHEKVYLYGYIEFYRLINRWNENSATRGVDCRFIYIAE